MKQCSKIKKYFFSMLILFAALSNCFSQEDNGFDSLDLPLIDSSSADSRLAEQRQLVYLDGLANYDLNPHTASYANEAQIFTALYEGLFSYNPYTLEPVPGLCVNYKTSGNKKRWTFTLREDGKFSDGSKITAETVKDSWISLLATPNAPFASLLDCIVGAEEFRTGKGPAENVGLEARNKTTLVVRLTKPCPYLMELLCHHAFAAVSTKKNVYSGAFKLGEKNDRFMVLEKNPEYWGASSVYIPSIKIFNNVEDDKEISYLFNNGTIDWVNGGANYETILNKNNINYCQNFGTTYLFFKQNNSPWDKKEFREALLNAVPYDKLREKYISKAKTLIPAFSLLYPNNTGISDYDEEDALDMMNAARDKFNIPRSQMIPLVFACSNEPYMKEWAEILSEAWKPLGVELVVQTTPSYRYNSSVSSWNADLFMYSWLGDFADPLAFLELFKTDSSLNVAGYSNANLDKKIEESAFIEDSFKRYEILSQAEKILLDDYEIIPISHTISVHLINKDAVGGWYINGLDIHPFKYLYFKKHKSTLPNLVRLETD